MINIPSYITDPNYRYRMPKMILKIEGKGNGIKTNITNLVDVAQSLRTDSECNLL
jgi:translation initiation factor 5